MTRLGEWLYALNSKGGVKCWRIQLKNNLNGTATIRKSHGIVGGKIQIGDRQVTKGKNIGRANETTPFEQAHSEAKSAYNKKVDEGYVLDLENLKGPQTRDESGFIRPMLAQTYKGQKSLFPLIALPKIHGVRCTATLSDINSSNMKVIAWSRGGKILKGLQSILPDRLRKFQNAIMAYKRNGVNILAVDGEAYVHSTEWDFQRIISRSKKVYPDTTGLGYHVFDLVIPGMEFIDRIEIAESIFKIDWKGINTLPYELMKLPCQVDRYLNNHIAEGYEGIVLRNPKGLYVPGHRSADMLKYKNFEDEEFKIIGYKQGDGRALGCIIFECWEPKVEKKFWVVPKGSLDSRKQMYKNPLPYIGKMLTVRFQERSVHGVPTIVSGIAIRDYE